MIIICSTQIDRVRTETHMNVHFGECNGLTRLYVYWKDVHMLSIDYLFLVFASIHVCMLA